MLTLVRPLARQHAAGESVHDPVVAVPAGDRTELREALRDKKVLAAPLGRVQHGQQAFPGRRAIVGCHQCGHPVQRREPAEFGGAGQLHVDPVGSAHGSRGWLVDLCAARVSQLPQHFQFGRRRRRPRRLGAGQVQSRRTGFARFQAQRRGNQRQQWFRGQQAVVEHREGEPEYVVFPGEEQRDRVPPQEPVDPDGVAGVDAVQQRRRRVAVRGEPPRGHGVQRAQPVRLLPGQFRMQAGAQQCRQPVQRWGSSGPDEQSGRFGELVQDGLGVRPVGQRGRESRRDVLADADRPQQFALGTGERGKYLVAQVILQCPVTPGEERAEIAVPRRRADGQAQCGGPALGPRDEFVHLVRPDRRTQELAGFLDGEPELVSAQLDEPVRQPGPDQRQRRLPAARQRQAQARGLMAGQSSEPVPSAWRGDLLDAVEHEQHRFGQCVEGVGQLCQESEIPARLVRHQNCPQ